jgi:galactonate dehydratase
MVDLLGRPASVRAAVDYMAGCVPWYYDVVRTPIRMKAGWWDVPTLPGLGIEVDLKAAEGHPFAPVEQTLKPAVLADGSIITR